MRVLIADSMLPMTAEGLQALGCEVTTQGGLKGAALNDALIAGEHQVLIVRSTQVTADMLGPGHLGLVVRAGAGVNTIDVEAASRSGIYVANCPGKNSLAVAELAIGLLVALDRRLVEAASDLRAGRFRKGEYSQANGLAGRTLGIIGAGDIGLAVAVRARGLGMKVQIWNRGDHRRDAVEAIGCQFQPDLRALAASSDAVSVHLAGGSGTAGLLDAAFFGALRPGALFVNTARDSVIEEVALLSAVRGRGLRAGLDVFVGEPAGNEAAVDLPLLREPGVIATPHIGASTEQAQEAVAREVVHIVRGYKESGVVANVVNVTARSPASHMLIVRHLNRIGVLAQVFVALKRAAINVEETQNIVFAGGTACIARIAIAGAPDPSALAALRADCREILDLNLVPLGADP